MGYLEKSNSETASRIEITRAWEEGAMWSCCLMGIEFLFRMILKVLEMDSSVGRTMVKMVIFMIHMYFFFKFY